MSTEDKLAALRAELSQRDSDELGDILVNLDSPIEELLLVALRLNYWGPPCCFDAERIKGVLGAAAVIVSEHDVLFVDAISGGVLVVQPMLNVGGRNMRPDFAIVFDGKKTAIELDGHDFHERTKEQAARDKSRDRALVEAGWGVLRFTGSEVYADPYQLARSLRESMLHIAGWRKRPEAVAVSAKAEAP